MESSVEKKVVKALEKLRAWTIKLMKGSKGGGADRLACVPVKITPEMVGKTFGLFVAVEVKDVGKLNETSGIQGYQLKKIRQAGGIGISADNWMDVVKAVQDIEVSL